MIEIHVIYSSFRKSISQSLNQQYLSEINIQLPVLVRPLSAIQSFSHPLTFNFSLSLGYMRKLALRSPRGNYFTSGFVCSQHTAPRNIRLTQSPPSQGTNSHLGQVEPRKFIACVLRHLRKASAEFEPWTSHSAVKRTTTGPNRLE